MSSNHLKQCLFFILLLFPIFASAASTLAMVQVKVTGLNNRQGVVRLAMFDTSQAFADKNAAAPGAFQKGVAIINERNQAFYVFKNVPYGSYAIKLFHDEDNSGKLKRNLFGKPQEGFGFSNNPPVVNQAPTFDQAKFIVNQPKVNMNIEVINP